MKNGYVPLLQHVEIDSPKKCKSIFLVISRFLFVRFQGSMYVSLFIFNKCTKRKLKIMFLLKCVPKAKNKELFY